MSYRNKIKFFPKTKNYSVTFLFALSFFLIVFNKTDYFIIDKIKSVGVDYITPITNVVTLPVKITVKVNDVVREFRSLKTDNLKLKEEVLRLKKWQTLAIINQMENQAYKKLLNSTSNSLKIVKTAKVVSQSPGFYSKTVVINAGINDGLSKNLTVINERGLVGKVSTSTDNNSTVTLIKDQNLSVPVKSMDSDFYAIITGSVEGKYLISSFIKEDKKPNVGDLLLTSGNAKTFPKDILVGKVIKVNENNFVALPYVDFEKIDYVQVIKNN